MTNPLRVLIVEDSQDDAQLILRELRRGGYEPTFEIVETAEQMQATLNQQDWEVILCDYVLPGFNAPKALELVTDAGLDIPFIVVSGRIGEKTAVEMMRAGAHDYMMKDNLARLTPAVTRELAEADIHRQRKRAEETVRLAAQRWQTTFDGVPDAVCLLDTQANVMQCNSAMAELAGRRPEECVGRNCCELIHGRAKHLEGCPFKRAGSSLRRETKELAVAGRWLQVTVDPLKDDEGKLTGAVHIVADITERKHAEEEIANLAKFPAEDPDPVLRVAKDGAIIFANKAAYSLLDAWSCRLDQALPKQWAELVASVLVSGAREDIEIESDSRMLLITFAPVVEAGYVNLYARDITDRKLAGEALRRSEERYRALFEQAADTIVLVDSHGQMVEFNDRAHENLGYTREEFRELKIADIEATEFDEQVEAHIKKIVREGSDTFETKHRTKSGEIRDVLVSCRPIDIPGGDFLLSVWHDITDSKQAQEALRQSEQRYRHLFEHLVDAAFLADADTGVIIETNHQGEELLGRSRREIVGMHQSSLHPSDKAGQYRRLFAEHIQKDRTLDVEAEVVRKDGRAVPVRFSASTMTIGQRRLILEIFHDITEKKRADEALKNSEHELDIRNRIAEIFLTVPDEEVYGDVLRLVLAAMDSKFGTFGYIDEDGALVVPTMTRDIWDKCQVPDKKIVYPRQTWGDSAWPRAIREKRTLCSNEPSTLMPEGHIPITRNIVVPIIHAGDVVGIFHVANKNTDYTQADIRLLETIGGAVAPVLNARLQRDRAQESLAASEKQYRTLVESVHDGVYLLDHQGRFTFVNDVIVERSGRRRDWFVGRSYLDVIVPEDRQRMQGIFATTMRGESTQPYETAYRTASGELLYIEVNSSPLFEGDEVVGLLAVSRNITERKRAEEVLRAERDKLTHIFEAMADGVYIVDQEHEIQYANPVLVREFGPYEDRKCYEYFHDRNEVCPWCKNEEVWAGKTVQWEWYSAKNDRTYDLIDTPLKNPDGSIWKVEIFRDITKRKRADEAVRRSHEELRALAARLQTAREEERKLLARKIHDDVGHALAALKMDLAWLGSRVAKAGDNISEGEKITERMESMSGLVDETIQTIRQTASELRPGLLDDVGLGAAIEWQAGQFQRRTGVRCTFTSTAEEVELDHEQSTALFRICQELLTNVASHAGATAVSIALKGQSDELVLEVSDNGKGIEEEQISSSGSLGILGMRERTLVLGGVFSIAGQDGKGTTATVRIPLGGAARTKGD